MSDAVRRGQVFRYEGFDVDAGLGLLTCRYSVDGRAFSERVTLAPGERWETPAAQAAARLVFLLAGVSYYKTAAPPVIDLGETALTELERAFLRDFYLQGLGEFAYRNALDLAIYGSTRMHATFSRLNLARCHIRPRRLRALVPFGGGIDSIVSVEHVRQRADVALFVVSRPGDRFEAIERPAAVSGLPVIRAGREIDQQLMRSAELGFLNGHVPVTGILSAIAVLAAVLGERDAVVMSNEWSASVPTLEHDGRPVNHQYSKSASFEAAFRAGPRRRAPPGCLITSPCCATGPSCGSRRCSQGSSGTTGRSGAATGPSTSTSRCGSGTGAGSATSAASSTSSSPRSCQQKRCARCSRRTAAAQSR